MGAEVDEVTTYLTKKPPVKTDQLIKHLEEKTIDLVTFTSSSTAKNFKDLLPPEKAEKLIQGITFASIGPITTETAIKLGFKVPITATSYTIPGLCEAIVNHFGNDNK
jgi:uroporphyrinogen III methyltransferase/synthase